MTTTTKLVFCYWGDGIALGIYGTKDDVSQTATKLFNFNATDTRRPIWLSEKKDKSFAYVLTDKAKLRTGYKDMFVADFLSPAMQGERKKLGRRLKGICEDMAYRRVASIAHESFLKHEETASEPYRLGYLQFDGEE